MIDNSILPKKLREFFYAWYGVAFLLIFPLDFPFFHHHSHVPRYNEDDHDVCRAYGGQLVVGIAWYLFLALIVAMKIKAKPWAVQLLFLPTTIFAVIGALCTMVLTFSYTTHNENLFGKTLGLFSGTAFAAAAIFANGLTKKSADKKDARRVLWSAVFFLLCGAIHALYESQYLFFLFLVLLVGMGFRGFHKFTGVNVKV